MHETIFILTERFLLGETKCSRTSSDDVLGEETSELLSLEERKNNERSLNFSL